MKNFKSELEIMKSVRNPKYLLFMETISGSLFILTPEKITSTFGPEGILNEVVYFIYDQTEFLPVLTTIHGNPIPQGLEFIGEYCDLNDNAAFSWT